MSNLGDSRKSKQLAGNSGEPPGCPLSFATRYSQGLNHSPDRLWGPIPNHSGAASSRMLKVLPITVTPSWNGQKLGVKTVKRKTTYTKNGKWSGHSFFTTRTSKQFGMILYVFGTTLPGPLSLISSTASPLYAYSFTTSWPEIETIRTLPNPHRGWSRSLSSAYNSSFCSSPEDDWPMAQGLLPMWSRKKLGVLTPLNDISCWGLPLDDLVSRMVSHEKNTSRLQYDEVQPVMNSNFLSVFGPLTMYSCSPCSFTFGSFWICVQNQNTQKLMRTHENSWYQSIPTLTHKISPWQENVQNLIINIKQKLEDTNDTSQNFRISPPLQIWIFRSSDLQIFSPLTQPGVSEPDSSSLCETCGIPQGKSWLISGWFPSKAI